MLIFQCMDYIWIFNLVKQYIDINTSEIKMQFKCWYLKKILITIATHKATALCSHTVK